jgi:hypothetical protein
MSFCLCKKHPFSSYIFYLQISILSNVSIGVISKINFCKCIRNIVFNHPVCFLYTSFTHYTSVHNATRLLSLSLPISHYMFRPYAAIIRCHYLLKLFHCVVCTTSPITCECDISHFKYISLIKIH